MLDEAGMKGYGYPENFEKLARCEKLAAKKGCTVTQIALSWIYQQGINAFAVVSTKNPERMKSNIAALDILLTAEESEYLSGK